MIYNGGKYNQDWDTKKLDELGKFSRGISKHRPRNDPRLFDNGKYPLVQTGDIKAANLFLTKHTQTYNDFGLNQSKLWDAGTLCITIAANIAETAILDYPMCFPDSVVGFQAYQEETSELFMHYLFEYIRNSIQNAASGSIQDNINLEYLMSLKFKIPKKEYQDKLVSILSSIDKKIICNMKTKEHLQLMAYEIFMHLFFDKNYNGKLGDIIIENPKSTIQVGEAKGKDGDYPFFTSGDSILTWDEPIVDGRNCYLNTGGNADIKFYVGKAAYSTDTWCITGTDLLSDYLYMFLESIKPELDKKFFQGTGLKHLQKPLLKDRPIYIPLDHEIEYFNSIVQPYLELISENTRESQHLIAFREWLLPILMNGQATITD